MIYRKECPKRVMEQVYLIATVFLMQ